MSSTPVALGTADGGPPSLGTSRSRSRRGAAARAVRGVLTDRKLAIPSLVLALMVLFAVFVPIFWHYGPDKQNLIEALQAPSANHPMGTDQLGRDVLARVSSGARISLGVAFLVAAVGAAVGGLIGLLAGTFGGLGDNLAMRVMDALLAFPPLILAMAVTVGLGVGLVTAAIGVTLVSIPWYARLIRSEAIRIRTLPFIEAAYALGAPRGMVVRRHIAPHLAPVLLIQMAAAFGYAVLALAGLSFVGLGAQVPTPEWGAMITEGLPYVLTGQQWIAVFPGAALLITVTAISMLSDRARDLLDPRGDYQRL